MNLNQAQQTYVAESHALLQDMEAALLRLENEPGDAGLIGEVFRAVHTIKGSAGLFGLDPIVAFTHEVESVLDQVRDGALSLNGELTGTLLACADHIGALVDTVADLGQAPDAALVAQGEALLRALQHHSGTGPASAPQQLPAEANDLVQSGAGSALGLDNWHISAHFGADVLRNGMDPASFIRYLGSVGEIVTLQLDCAQMPPLDEMDPEACYLGFEIDLKSDAGKKALEDVFEFVHDDCRLRILPPPSHLIKCMEQIANLPGDVEKLGEILMQVGILTESELAEALELQRQADAANAGNAASEHTPLGTILSSQGMVPDEAVNAALNKQKQIRDTKSQESKFIRVNAEKLDRLIDLVGELIIAGASASLLARLSGNASLHEANSLVSRYVEEIREEALRLRMVQIGDTFNRFQRVVRDVSKEIGKDIALEISGGDTELDKTVVEKIGDPLMHLVRNAMDHGIEPAELRASRGKPARGTVRLNAYHDCGSIVVEVADDGGGLDRDKILAKGIERGLVGAGQGWSDREIFNLIFEPGFSTADQVTNLSGRGVGMDVVKRNIHALRGTIDIDSTPQAGTTVRIRLPLTLAIIDGFLVAVGATSFVVPLDIVLECLELELDQDHAARQRDFISLRGVALPLIDLRAIFGITGTAGRFEHVVVVNVGGAKAGLIVDKLHGGFQTVIKPLSKMFSQVPCISGSTILGDGGVGLILDVGALVRMATEREAAAQDALAV